MKKNRIFSQTPEQEAHSHCDTVAVYPRNLRAKRKERISPDRLKIRGNCIKTIDYSICIYILKLNSYINAFTCSWCVSNTYHSPVNVHVTTTYWIRSTPVYWSRLGLNLYGTDTNNYIGADNTSQTLIKFDWYNPHPYQRTTRIIKIFQLTRYFPLHKNHSRAKHKFMKVCICNSTFP